MDPEKLFVVSAISRRGIAEDLNGYLEQHNDEPRLLSDDSRLTDAICKAYATELGNVDMDLPEEAVEEEFCRIQSELLANLGLLEEEKPSEGDADYCPNTANHRHTPDPASLTPADGAGRNRGTDWIVDVVCIHCGRSGSARIDPDSTQW
jgi:hypothetical protein